MKSFFSNLNTRLIVIHFIAFWLFAYGFFTLSFLWDYKFMHLASERTLALNNPDRVHLDKELIRQAGNFGLLAAYVISWLLASRRNWHWENGVVIFVIIFPLYNLGYLGWNIYHSVFQSPGSFFPPNSIWQYLTNGLVMLGVGLVLFYLPAIKRYIDRGNAASAIKGNKSQRKAAKAKFAKS